MGHERDPSPGPSPQVLQRAVGGMLWCRSWEETPRESPGPREAHGLDSRAQARPAVPASHRCDTAPVRWKRLWDPLLPQPPRFAHPGLLRAGCSRAPLCPDTTPPHGPCLELGSLCSRESSQGSSLSPSPCTHLPRALRCGLAKSHRLLVKLDSGRVGLRPKSVPSSVFSLRRSSVPPTR